MRVRYQRARWTYDVALPPWPLHEQRPEMRLAFALGFVACCGYIAGVAESIRGSLLLARTWSERREATPSQDAGDGSPTTRGGDRQA